MAKIICLFFMMLIINKEVMTFSVLGIEFEDIINVFQYVNTVYTKGMEYAFKEEINRMDPAQQLTEIMSDLKDMSMKLTNFVSHQDEKMDRVVETLLNNIELMGELQTARNYFVQYIDNVDYWFQNGIEYEINEGYSEKTLKNFIKSVLWSPDNIDHILFKIYRLIFPDNDSNMKRSFLLVALEYTENKYQLLCDKYISPQQQFYYIFTILIRTQLKAFTTVTQAYTMQSALDHVNYTHEYKAFKQTFHQRLTNYFESFIYYMARFPADVRTCDVVNPVLDKNIFEMDGLFQVIANYELFIKQTIYPEVSLVCGDCEEISNNNRMKFMIHNCKTYSSIKGCLTSVDRYGFYAKRVLWFEGGSEFFGHENECKYGITEMNRLPSPALFCWNDLCVCSVNTTDQTNFPDGGYDIVLDPPRINKISLEPQYSDIANNMIVVGVKFILHDNAIHLQIQQSKIAKGGAIVDKGLWKPVNVDNNNNTINIRYGILFDRRNRLYLDDVLGHPDSVVTGVKFAITKDGSGFELHIQSTKYNHKTGQLTNLQSWFEPGQYAVYESDYQRNRVEIILNDPDDPTMAHGYKPDPQSNKFVQFQHSSIKKDAGYHTVPFFDGQPVETQMKFPLSGIGLFHRGRDGFGGYIAPRLITYNMTRPIELSFNNWKELEKMYKDCGLEVPVNVTVFKENVNCEILKQIADRQVPNRNISQINWNNTINLQSVPNYKFITSGAQPIAQERKEEQKEMIEKQSNEVQKHKKNSRKSPCLPRNQPQQSAIHV